MHQSIYLLMVNVTVMVHVGYMGLQKGFSFEAQLHNLSELINTNGWYGYGELMVMLVNI